MLFVCLQATTHREYLSRYRQVWFVHVSPLVIKSVYPSLCRFLSRSSLIVYCMKNNIKLYPLFMAFLDS